MKFLLSLFLACIGSSLLGESFLSDAEVALFHQQGYLIKPGLFASEVREMDRRTAALMQTLIQDLAARKELLDGTVHKVYTQGAQVVFKSLENGSISILRVVSCADLDPYFGNVLRGEAMVDSFFHLLASEEIEHLICQFHPKMPKDGVAFDKHRDVKFRKAFDPSWNDIRGNGSYAIGTIAVDPMTPENGGLFIDRGSYPLSESWEEDLIAIFLEPGDLLFMHPDILHWSGENNSTIPRRSLLTGFCSFGANHKNYPGNFTNDCFSKKSQEISITPAPWKKLGDTDF